MTAFYKTASKGENKRRRKKKGPKIENKLNKSKISENVALQK